MKPSILNGLVSVLSASSFFLIGCGGETFRSSNNDIKGVDQELVFSCTDGSQNSAKDVSGSDLTQLKVKGQLCSFDALPQKVSSLSVLFVVDFSGSMAGADPGNGSTCGRSDAARVMVNGLSQQLSNSTANSANGANGAANARIDIGAVSFGENAEVRVPMTPLTSFATSSVNSTNFCGQDGQKTNYEAAFVKAREVLAGIQGPKVVYFISDGLPTASLSQPSGASNVVTLQNSGLNAANSLRSLPELTLNVIFLQSTAAYNPESVNAEQYLAQIAGDASRVKIATSASQLVAQVQAFEPPKPKRIDQNRISAVIRGPGGGEQKNVNLELKQSSAGVWEFETEQFKPFVGAVGQMKTNQLVVSAPTSDGGVAESVITINYNRIN